MLTVVHANWFLDVSGNVDLVADLSGLRAWRGAINGYGPTFARPSLADSPPDKGLGDTMLQVEYAARVVHSFPHPQCAHPRLKATERRECRCTALTCRAGGHRSI